MFTFKYITFHGLLCYNYVFLQGIGDSAQGFANFVLYCISTEKIRHRLVALVCPSSFAEFATETEMVSQSREVKRNKVGITNVQVPLPSTSKQI